MEAYRIGIALHLNNLISPQLVKLSREFEVLDKLAVSLSRTMKGIASDAAGFAGLSRSTAGLSRNLSGAATGADKLSANLATATARATALQREMAAIRTTAAAGGGAGLVGGGGGRNTGGHHGGLHGGNLHIGNHGVGMSAIGVGGLPMPLLAGAAVVGGSAYIAKSFADAAGEIEQLTVKLKAFGMTAEQNTEALKFARGLQIKGRTQTDNLHTFIDAQGAFRESGLEGHKALEAATIATPMLAKIQAVASQMDGDKQSKILHGSKAMMRFIEMSGGLQSPERFNELANFGFKLNTTSGRIVDWEQLRQYKARAGMYGQNDDLQSLAGAEPLIAERTGSTFGRDMLTSGNRLSGIVKIPNQAAHALVETGVWDKNKVIWNKNGGIAKLLGNPLSPEAQDKFLHKKDEFFLEYLDKVLAGFGSQDDQTRMAAMILGAGGGAIRGLALKQRETMKNSRMAYGTAQDVDTVYDNTSKTYEGNKKEFGAAVHDFKIIFGETMLPQITSVIKAVSEGLRGIGAWYEANKSAMQEYGAIVQKWMKWSVNESSFLPKAVVNGASAVYDFVTGGGPKRGAGGSVLMPTQPGAVKTESPYIPVKKAEQADLRKVDVYMDGKKVSDALDPHMAKKVGTAHTGGLDSGASAPLPASKR